MAERDFDAVVIGAGPAGEVIAGRLADAELEVALVEPELVGGECSFWACMPSKALLRPAELLAEVKRVPGLPVDGELDAERVLARRDEVVHDYDDDAQLPWIEDRGIELFRGEGRLDGERRVAVGDDVLTARKAVVIATGSAGSIPPIDGLAELRVWTNREVTSAKVVPASLIVIGGGVVGTEMAQAWSSLGTTVDLIEPEERILIHEEPFAAEEVEAALGERGVRVHTDVGVERVSRAGEDGPFTVELSSGETLEGEQVLVAAGRKPRVDGIGLESVGIDADGPLEVDDGMRVGDRDWLYAVGDVNGRALLTHMGKYQARVAAANILGGDAKATRDLGGVSPRVIFTDPEIAAAGYTLAAAKEAGIDAEAVDVSTAGNAGASFHGRNAEGTSRLVIDTKGRVVVGATFVGPDANELLHAATVAIVGEVPLDRLFEAVPAFPTRNEIWLNLLEKYGL